MEETAMRTEILLADTPSLKIAYLEDGPKDADAVLLLHGFPYDVRQYDALRQHLSFLNLRVITPYLRGYGPTEYQSVNLFRSGQQAALGKDVVDFMDSLKIPRAFLVGYDWGGRAACVAAALWPERVHGLLSVGGYTIQDIARSSVTPQSAEQEHQFWYQWYFQTERGRIGLQRNRKEICRLLWSMWSPNWKFREDDFDETALSFENPDFVDTVVQSYRHRYGNAAGDPALESLERELATQPKVHVPTIVMHGGEERVDPPSTSSGQEAKFTAQYERRLIPGAGHCLPAEAPRAMSEAIHDLVVRATK